jgi:transposase InsO family protein
MWRSDYIRSDNGPEFTAKRVKDWLERVEVKTLFLEPGSPWENGYVESFDGKLRDELLKGNLRQALGSQGGVWSITRSARTVRWATGRPHRKRFSHGSPTSLRSAGLPWLRRPKC